VNKSPEPSEQVIHIVDDDEALRDSLVWMLESNGYRTRSFASGEDFLAMFNDTMAGCVLLDVRMPGISGLELFELLRARNAGMPVIFITGHGDVPMAVEALKRGAQDFIEKPFGDREVLSVIEEALARERNERGQRVLKADVSRRLADLTQREYEVLQLILAGKLNKQIADVLGISIKTVEVHRARVMEKMGVRSLAELVQHVMTVDSSVLRS
jgi:FixJ family two-component response regulator